ncbi:MAG: NifU family protein [Treponema sp.]|nr:NifU family protein [Treponema sp.]MDE6245238.1 NifU family protein [Treponemataceae bacterium]MBD5408896.1 NifU family protein [Treponema sp.]MBD5411588.1 NifU family protein [Treponema sp.]MBD5413256.1 NifU family protein [Treponema sp.]
MEETNGTLPTIEERVKEAMEMFRPQLQADGGDMEFVGIDEQNRVHLNLVGACGSCPMAVMTLKMGVERYIQDAVPEITEVVQDNARSDFYSDF